MGAKIENRPWGGGTLAFSTFNKIKINLPIKIKIKR